MQEFSIRLVRAPYLKLYSSSSKSTCAEEYSTHAEFSPLFADP